MASAVTKKKSRQKPAMPRAKRRQRTSSAAHDEHLKELMKQAVREVITELDEVAWDRQITTDVDSGKLDRLIRAAREEIAQGKAEALVFEG